MHPFMRIFPAGIITCLISALTAQSHVLTVENGYGSGIYMTGDTVHVWNKEHPGTEIFDRWTGETSTMESIDEWHTTLVMPDEDITIRSVNRDMPDDAGYTEDFIMGRDTIKRVYYYFPSQYEAKGVVWLFHGTGGSARQFVDRFESRYFANRLMADSFAIITTESEETTKNVDLDTSGTIRWQYYPDTINNPDLANVRAIRDTFINRGLIQPHMPMMAAGFSAGGAFSVGVAWLLDWKASITNCTPGPIMAPLLSNVPSLFSMTWNDRHPEVGIEGNMAAYEGYQSYQSRGICSEFYMMYPIPLHPERFARFPGISLQESQLLFDELDDSGALDAQHYLVIPPLEIIANAIATPQNWPVTFSLSQSQQEFLREQLDYLWTAHYFHSDFTGKYLRFLNDLCGLETTAIEEIDPAEEIFIFPNPVTEFVHIMGDGQKHIYNLKGQLMQISSDAGIEGQIRDGEDS